MKILNRIASTQYGYSTRALPLVTAEDIPNLMSPRKPLRSVLTSAALGLAVLGLIRPALADTDNTGTGGTITYTDVDGLNPRSSPPHVPGYVVHAFSGSDTLDVPIAVTADVLTVGGGGGGGTVIGGGGGAGGLLYSTSVSISAGATAVVVGAGGAGATDAGGWQQGANGTNSSFGASLTANSGGGGGGWNNNAGRAGGSGGGGCKTSGGTGITGQGYAGGSAGNESPGGGGGASSLGFNGTNGGAAGAGGTGLEYAISGVSTWYAGGGGGGGGNSCNARGVGGSGGGGAGGPPNSGIGGTNGVAGTGGGGGGGSWSGGTNGGAGGSGIVIVKYPYSSLALSITVSSPAASQIFPNGSSISATAGVMSGTGPYHVSFFADSAGGGMVQVGSTQTGDGPVFTQALGSPSNGTYHVYATVTDSVATSASSVGNTTPFTVVTAVATTTTLASSANPSMYPQALVYTATVLDAGSSPPSGGTVQFYADGNPLGSPVSVNTGTGQALCNPGLLTAASYSVTAHFSGSSQYVASDASALTQTVNKAVLTVTADNKVRAPGTANPSFTYKISGYVNSENLSSAGVTGTPVLACSADTSSPVGSYDITCDVGDLAAANYSFTTHKGTLTVQVGAPPVSNGMVCWFDASTITVADGAQVNTWNDLSGNGHTATRVSGNPVISISDIKYDSTATPKKGVHFRGTDDYYDCAGGMWVKEQYVVVRSPNPTWVGSGSFLGRKSDTFLAVRASSHNFFSGYTGFWDDELPAAVSKNGTVVSSSRGSMPRGGFELGRINDYMILKIIATNNASAANLAAYPFYQIGRTETLSGAEMDIAEIIGYETTLSTEDEAAVGAYLAQKYGLATTYPNTTPQAVVASFSVGALSATIDQARRTISIPTLIGTEVSAIVPTFTLSDGATCTVNGSPLESGVTSVNFMGLPVHCIVTSSDSLITSDYTLAINWVSTLGIVITALDVTASGDGSQILNEGTLVEANHVGPSGVTALTLPSTLTFGISTAHMTGYGSGAWGGGGQSTNTDGNSAGAAGALTDATAYGKLMREYIWSSASASHLDIPGLVPGHIYRLQWITTSPRGGNISVEGSPSVALAPNSSAARVFSFTWVAIDTAANALVTRQAGSYPTDSEIVFNGYALHDIGVSVAGAVISGVPSSQSISVGAPVTLSGTVSDGGTVYPAVGEAVSITVNGLTEYTTVGSNGAFSIEFPTTSLVGGTVYPITYGYAGNWLSLASAPNHTSTALAVSGPAVISNVTPSSTRVVGASIVTLSGTVSNGATGYPAAGDTVQITINGVSHPATISGGVGAFSLAFPIAAEPIGVYPITYSYAGNGLMLSAAPDHTSTSLTVVATAGTAYEALVKASGPVSYWPLNETSGTTALDIVGSNNATYAGTYALNQEPLRNTDGQPCVLPSAGNTGLPYNSSLNPALFTVECWVKATSISPSQYLVSLQDRSNGANRLGYALQRNNGNGGFQFTYGIPGNSNATIMSTTTIAIGRVYHVAVTYDGATVKMYVNGALESSAALPTYVPATATQEGFGIGSRNGNTTGPTYIQDVALYSHALTAADILTHYQGAASTSGYASWAGVNAPTGTATSDFDGDGVSNALEYVLGGTKNTNDLGKLPKISADGTKFTFTLPASSASTGTALRVEFSTDLSDWTTHTATTIASGVSGLIEVTIPNLGAHTFARLEVTVP